MPSWQGQANTLVPTTMEQTTPIRDSTPYLVIILALYTKDNRSLVFVFLCYGLFMYHVARTVRAFVLLA